MGAEAEAKDAEKREMMAVGLEMEVGAGAWEVETGVVARVKDAREAVVAPVAHRRVFPAGALVKEVVEREMVAVGLEMAGTA